MTTKPLPQRLADMFADTNFDEDYLERHDINWEPLLGWKPWFNPINYVWVAMRVDNSRPLPENITAIANLKDSQDPRDISAMKILTELYNSYIESRD